MFLSFKPLGYPAAHLDRVDANISVRTANHAVNERRRSQCTLTFARLCPCLWLQGWTRTQQELSFHHPRASPKQCTAHASEGRAHIHHGR